MSPLVAIPLSVAIVGAYLGVRTVLARPGRVRAAAPTPDLRDEPPAVVNLLINRLTDAPQVASATLLDLAARRTVEIHGVADGADHTMVRLREGQAGAGGAEYERLILDRVARVAGDRFTPVASLVRRYAEGGYHWQRRLVRHAVLDARRRGLIAHNAAGCGLAFVVSGVAAAVLLSPALPAPTSSRFWPAVAVLAVVWLFLAGVGALILPSVSLGEAMAEPDRYTAKGRAVTAHWLGVREWLRAHESMRDLPPAAVAVWDRYLAYGVALDAVQHAVRVLDFEAVGHRDELPAGAGRTVRVRYWRDNRLLRPLGPAAAQARLIWAVFSVPLWAGVGLLALLTVAQPYLRFLILALAAVQLVRALYRLVRSAADLASPATVEGVVLDMTVAGRQRTAEVAAEAGFDLDDLPTHYYVVIDDGSHVLRPWIVNRGIAWDGNAPAWPPAAGAAWQAAFAPGDRVRLTGQRWSRYASSMTLLDRGRPA